ncbi:radical SAM protein [Bradyrhizobium oligotrophicum]|uniref:radical SAM protein n=1 Tax=Bradyrhizobium oligotrophicum TaxID=44255 RepID=UPI003EB8EB34
MGVELRPFGVACNLACTYCYQNPLREAGNLRQSYDMAKMKAALDREGSRFILFGGEPLLMKLADLEELLAYGHARHGGSGVQTNGVLINDAHVALFKRYNVQVGISIDGPDELNDARADRKRAGTRHSTAAVQAAIERLCREHQPPGLIVTLHRGNASAAMLPRMFDWMRELDAAGVRSARLHLLEVDDATTRDTLALSVRENVAAILGFARLQDELKGLRFDLIEEMKRLLSGDERGVSCVWRACDPLATAAVRGIEGNGQSSNCGRTNKDGVDYLKADSSGYERSIALYHTPQAYGGCHGCRFFLMCKGQCPGTAIGGDWRNRTEHCAIWMALFATIENQLIRAGETPLSIHPLREQREIAALSRWGTQTRVEVRA